ncbi:hypothetical protein BC628DRAFT_1337621 [Trametes gibbosa]|nr:hypothetical protein BC628DRAFT_1337621 [Trametes gibbosa]
MSAASPAPTSASTPASAPLTGALGPCCTSTVPHTGTPRGTVEHIAGLATTPGSSERTRVILYFADVFGPLYVNAQLAMDYWAACGSLVLGVDYFEGDSAASRGGTPTPRVTPPWIAAVRAMHGGGPGTTFFAVESPPGALLMSCPEDDFTFPHAACRRAEDVLLARRFAAYHLQIFGGGFATRPDPALPAERPPSRSSLPSGGGALGRRGSRIENRESGIEHRVPRIENRESRTGMAPIGWAKEEAASAVLRWFDHHHHHHHWHPARE